MSEKGEGEGEKESPVFDRISQHEWLKVKIIARGWFNCIQKRLSGPG